MSNLMIHYNNLSELCDRYKNNENDRELEKTILNFFRFFYSNKEEFFDLAIFFKERNLLDLYEKANNVYLSYKANSFLNECDSYNQNVNQWKQSSIFNLFGSSISEDSFKHYVITSLELRPTNFSSGSTKESLTSFLGDIGWLYKKEIYKKSIQEIVKIDQRKTYSSVVVISNQGELHLIKTLDEIKRQSRTNDYKVIFVSNNISNKTERVLGLVDTFIQMGVNCGAYLSRNIGSIFAFSEILVFIDDDGLPSHNFVKAHENAHLNKDIISVRGACLSKTNGIMPEHYWLGMNERYYPTTLEGNCSFKAKKFYEASGWGDYILFGHGGLEICYRMINSISTPKQHIYSPQPILYHDWTKNNDISRKKELKQHASWQLLKFRYQDFHNILNNWKL